jgi:type II secretory pathway component GspD/PulD (secretin)
MRCALLLFSLLLCTRLSAQVKVEIHPFVHADPAVVQEAVRALVPGDRKVMLNPGRQEVLVVADPETQALVKDLIARLDRPVPNVRIRVNFDGAGAGSAVGGGVQVSGDIFAGRGGGLTVSPSLQAQSTTTRSTTSQMLVVQSGREARLQVGERTPHLQWIMTRGLAFATVQADVVWEEVGSYLVIQPVVVGEGAARQVKVRVTPELSGRVAGQSHQVQFSRVATEIMARPGQTVDLGGLSRENEFFSRFLIGADRRGGTENLKITLTPEILD